MQEQTRNDALETLKSIGFMLFHAIGWIAYIPAVAVILIFYGIFVMIIAQILGWIGKYIGFNGMRIMLLMVFMGAAAAAALLQMAGVPVQFDPRKVGAFQVPGMLIRSIFGFIRPNRFTFFFGCAVTAYVLVFEAPALLRR